MVVQKAGKSLIASVDTFAKSIQGLGFLNFRASIVTMYIMWITAYNQHIKMQSRPAIPIADFIRKCGATGATVLSKYYGMLYVV